MLWLPSGVNLKMVLARFGSLTSIATTKMLSAPSIATPSA
jgi:hypothetical protein